MISSGPGESRGLLQIMLALIGAARRELVLTTPYFVPEDALVTALHGAAARGVKVTIILRRRSTRSSCAMPAGPSSTRSRVGAEIAPSGAGFCTPKSITVDGTAAMFGTANFDMRKPVAQLRSLAAGL